MSHRLATPLLVALTITVVTPAARAQDFTTGVRESARLLDSLPRGAGAGALGVNYNLLAMPGVTGVNGATVYGATFGFINKTVITRLPFQLKASGSSIDFGATSKMKVAGEAKAVIPALKKIATVAVRGMYAHTEDIGNRTEATLAGERQIWNDKSNTLKIGLTGNWVTKSPTGGTSTNGGTFLPGLIWNTGSSTEIDADYQFKSDIDGEDTYSASVIQALPGVRGSPTLIFATGKHRLVVAKILFIR